MKTVGSYDAKTHLPSLLLEVEQGESITITKHGKPIAKLVPVNGERKDVKQVIEEFRAYSKRQNRSLGGSSIRELIEEGRR